MGDIKNKTIPVTALCPNNCKDITLVQVKDVCGDHFVEASSCGTFKAVIQIYLFKEITEAKCNAAGTCHMEIKMELEGPTYKGAPSFHAGMDCTKKDAGPTAWCTCVTYLDE
uniref:Uncharacterized protein n=1 Tax=Cacopsylla melanoneura TaxID=428564 RepID=A0A8D8PX08_9HEMI